MGIGRIQTGYDATAYALGNSVQKVEAETMDYRAFLQEKCEEILQKLKDGETEPSYQIGAQSFTEREWDTMLRKFDADQEAVREQMRARFEKLEKKREAREREVRHEI